jgi:hypothetical protein
MFAVLLGAQTSADETTGSRIGRWIDTNFSLAMLLTAAVVLLVIGSLLLLVRGYGRQLRRNRRLLRQHATAVQSQLRVLNDRIDELRDDIRQLGEIEDNVVGQLKMLRSGLNLDEPIVDLRELSDERLTAAAARSAPPQAATPVATASGSRSGHPRRTSLHRPVGAAPDPSQPSGDPPGPALLVETGEPMRWATRRSG